MSTPLLWFPVAVALIWILHVCLRFLRRPSAKYTFWFFLLGLPALVVVFFLSSMNDPMPGSGTEEVFRRRGSSGLALWFLAGESLLLWMMAGLAELILYLILGPVRKKTRS